MAAILTVANIHFDTTGTTRIEHLLTDGVVRVNAKGLRITGGSVANRPSNAEGLLRYNTEYGKFEFYDATGWANVTSSALVSQTGVGANAYADSIVGSSFNKANAANLLAFQIGGAVAGHNTVLTTANTAQVKGEAAHLTANLAFNKANAANITADAALPKTGGTISGSLTTTGTITAGTNVSDSKGNVRVIPINSQSAAYILAASDIGKFVSISVGGITVPASIFNAGDAISIYNNSGANQTITQGSGVTLYLAGTATTGNRTIAQRGIVTILCVAANTFVITGSGLT